MNIHAPERHPDETQQQYRERRALSNILGRNLTTNPPAFVQRAGSKPPSREDKRRAAQPFDSGQHPKFAKPRKHKPKKAIKPTWPATPNQERQSRPVHDLHPNREPDAAKRAKPKSAVAKRMDRPHRVAEIERGHVKLMRWFGA